MRRTWLAASVIALLSVLLTGCSDDGDQVEVAEGPAPGFSGGCEDGFIIFSQAQFSDGDGNYGALVRGTIDGRGMKAGLAGNDKLKAVGWYDTGEQIYPDNPEGIQGEIWYFIPELPNGGSGWVADAGVRAVKTQPAPGDRDKFYKPDSQAAPQPSECELTR